jgi:hypothetical protein
VTSSQSKHDEIDIGETLPARCLRQGLWLARQGTVPFALLLSFGTYIEIAVPPGEAAAQLSRRFLDELEEFVRRTGSYRGKVISLDRSDGYSGKHTPVYVHKLHNVQRDEVILQKRLCDFSTGISGTLCVNVRSSGSSDCLSRRVSSFMAHPERERLTQFTI